VPHGEAVLQGFCCWDSERHYSFLIAFAADREKANTHIQI